jgi:hypothetical protein
MIDLVFAAFVGFVAGSLVGRYVWAKIELAVVSVEHKVTGTAAPGTTGAAK